VTPSPRRSGSYQSAGARGWSSCRHLGKARRRSSGRFCSRSGRVEGHSPVYGPPEAAYAVLRAVQWRPSIAVRLSHDGSQRDCRADSSEGNAGGRRCRQYYPITSSLNGATVADGTPRCWRKWRQTQRQGGQRQQWRHRESALLASNSRSSHDDAAGIESSNLILTASRAGYRGGEGRRRRPGAVRCRAEWPRRVRRGQY
jgi:hypothetical protein